MIIKKIYFFQKNVFPKMFPNGNTKSAELVVVLLFPKMFPYVSKLPQKWKQKVLLGKH